MDIDCKYKKCTAYLYDYEPEFDIDFAWKIQNGLEENPQNYQLFIELADALHGTNVNQEYLCLEMAEFYSKQSNASIDTLDNVTRRMEEIVDSGELLVYPVSVIVISSENKTYNQGIREAEWCNDILLVNREIELKANTLFWLRMGLYEDRRVAATISRSEEDLFSPYEATVYSPYENRMYSNHCIMLIKRSAIEETGLVDEHFNSAQYIYNDMCMKLISSGNKVVLCKNSVISYLDRQIREEDHFDQRRFRQKWGMIPWRDFESHDGLLEFIERKQSDRFSVLEVDCGIGSMLSTIKGSFPNSYVLGVEPEEGIQGYVGQVVPFIPGNVMNTVEYLNTRILCNLERNFDYVILENSICHVDEPELLLKYVSSILSENGRILISVPNVMHASLIAGLLHGNFTYGNKGLLDRKNIRLFTWKEIMSLLRDAGLEVEECKYTVGEESVFTKEAELLTAISNIPNVADEIMFTAYEYLFLLRRK